MLIRCKLKLDSWLEYSLAGLRASTEVTSTTTTTTTNTNNNNDNMIMNTITINDTHTIGEPSGEHRSDPWGWKEHRNMYICIRYVYTCIYVYVSDMYQICIYIYI